MEPNYTHTTSSFSKDL